MLTSLLQACFNIQPLIELVGGIVVLAACCKGYEISSTYALSSSNPPTMQSYAIEGLVTPGSLLSVSNLSYRDHGHRLPTASATDITTFSQSPQDIHLKNALAELKEKIPVCLCSYIVIFCVSYFIVASYPGFPRR